MALRDSIHETPIVDHHAHAIASLGDAVTPAEFAGYFTEGPGVEQARHTVYYRTGLQLLRERFDADSEEELVAARSSVDLPSYSRDLLNEANISHILQDTGIPTGLGPADFEPYTDATIKPILRLETEAEGLLDTYDEFSDFDSAFRDLVDEALTGDHVALKSIVAYRTGLQVTRPGRAEAARAFYELKTGWDGRLEEETLNNYLIDVATDIAARHDAPIQFHTGFGDADANPNGVDPGLMHDFLQVKPEVNVVFLHASYPYTQKAGYMASVLENAYVDLGMTIPFVQHGVERLLEQALELAPTTKILYSSDGFVVPEWYYLGAKRVRSALEAVLERMVDEGYLRERYAAQTASNILRENAEQLYNL